MINDGQIIRGQHLLVCEHNLWRAVPPGCDILRHMGDTILGVGVKPPAQPKVTDFEFTVGVHQQVPWFKVPVDDGGRVDIFHSFARLSECT